MLPMLHFQQQTYRLGEKNPPSGSMEDHTPHWAITDLVLAPLASQQVRMNLQPDFHWLATLASGRIIPALSTVTQFPINQIQSVGVGLNQVANVGLPTATDVTLLPGDVLTFSGMTTLPQLNGTIYTITMQTSVPFAANNLPFCSWFSSSPLAPSMAIQLRATALGMPSLPVTAETGTVTLLRRAPQPSSYIASIFSTGANLIGLTDSPPTNLVIVNVGDQITFGGLIANARLNGSTSTVLALGPFNTLSNPMGIPIASENVGFIASDLPPGNFRVQIYDTQKALRMADRGVQLQNLGGDAHGPQWLRDPYHFDLPDSQVLLIVQNLEQQTNQIQVALYGQVLRFNQ
jgi:hypothetical protein